MNSETKMEIEVLYSCDLCGIKDRKVMVQAREQEDVIVWLKEIMSVALIEDHKQHSPKCFPEEFAKVMIPIKHADRIGGPAVN